jgi:acyl dehydratase
MRYYDDFSMGASRSFGARTLTQSEIIEFAERFDPQPFHTDSDAANNSVYDGLIASGLHTFAVTIRLMADYVTADAAFVGAVGIDDLRWPAPVRPGDTLSVETTVVGKEIKSEENGLVTIAAEVHSERKPVMEMRSRLLFERQSSDADSTHNAIEEDLE